MTADDVLNYAEPLIAAQRSLAKMADQASLGRWEYAQQHLACAAEQLVKLETVFGKLQAQEDERMRRRIVRALPVSEGFTA